MFQPERGQERIVFRDQYNETPEVRVQGDFTIGERLIQPRINSIEYDGETFHLEPKVMQVLLALAKEHGEVVTRDALRQTVWPDVFVGEDVLIRAISEIRRVFRDDPKLPHTIQTVPKVGYRLIAEVHLSEEPRAPVTVDVAPDPDAPEFVQAPVPDGRAQPRRQTALIFSCLGALLLLAAVGISAFRHGSSRPSYTVQPLTTEPGFQLQPALSPDGDTVAYVWIKPGESDGHIYIKAVSSVQSTRLTGSSSKELSPAWSPDGRRIALLQEDSGDYIIAVISAFGGEEQQVYRLPSYSVWEYGGLAWSADGKKLIFPQRPAEDQASRLMELDLDSRQTTALTSPPADWDGDWTPEVSPDGKWLSFVRSAERSARELYVMELPSGTPRALTADNALIVGQTWTEDSEKIVFASSRAGDVSLWSIGLKGGEPEHEPVGSDSAYAPTLPRHGDRLVYSRGNADWSVAQVTDSDKGVPSEKIILSSTEQDSAPSLSPEGKQIAFQSWRSGMQEIWTANVDGSNLIQLTNGRHSAGSPSWSPDGRSICFDARVDGISHIYILDASGGIPRALTEGKASDIIPSWAPDGHSIFFGSNRSGKWEIWQLNATQPGSPQQVTTAGAMVGKTSPDGGWLYFTKFAEPGLWRQSLPTGTAEKISANPPASFQDYWTPAGEGILALASAKKGYEVRFVDPMKHTESVVYTYQRDPSPFAGIATTPDRKVVYLTLLEHAGSNLRMVEGFR